MCVLLGKTFYPKTIHKLNNHNRKVFCIFCLSTTTINVNIFLYVTEISCSGLIIIKN